MDWIKLSTENFEAVLNKRQLELLESENGKNPDRNFAEDILNSTIALTRTHIAASGINLLDIDHSRIPPELRECVLRLAVEALQARIPSLELSKTQQRQGEIVRHTLEMVSNGSLPVSRPLIGLRTANKRKGISAARGSTNSVSRKTMEGI